jgi:hypothetical protein
MTGAYGDVDITPLFSHLKLPTGVRLMLDTANRDVDHISVWVFFNDEPKGEVVSFAFPGEEPNWTVASAATMFMRHEDCMDFEGGVNYLRNTLGF